jgi:hypothetical protein
MTKRFADRHKTIYAFSDYSLVVCPQCHQCAEVISRDTEKSTYRPTARLTCLHCGYAAEAARHGYSPGKPEDWFFHRPLWLQVPCAGQILWAHNRDHLNYLAEFIQAGLRENLKDKSGWHNNSMLNRLPRWMKQATNREAVMAGIEKLRKRMLED